MVKERVPWGRNSRRHEIPTVKVRPLEPTDVALCYTMHQRLSGESIFARYLHYHRPDLKEVADVTSRIVANGAGVIATVREDEIRMIGLAYYLRDEQCSHAVAELSMVVADEYQGLGVGRLLSFAIARHARAQKVEQLRLIFHPGNHRVRQLIQGSGYLYQQGVCDGLNDFTLMLTQTEPLSFVQRCRRYFTER